MRDSVRLLNYSLIIVLVVTVELISKVTSYTIPDSAILNSEDDPYVRILETLALSLDADSFRQDPVLVQQLDRMNSISKYNDIEDPRTTIFERQALDKDKEVVVLSTSQDLRLVSSFRKRTYVVLRQVHLEDGDQWDPKDVFYSVTYAYIRDARETDEVKEVISLNDKSITVEWDTYDNRPARLTKFHKGWSNCASTVLFTCVTNRTAIENSLDEETIEAITDHEIPKPLETADTKISQGLDLKEQELIIGSESSFDPDEYSDLYGDFDLQTQSTREDTGRGLFSAYQGSLCQGFNIFGGGGNCNSNRHQFQTAYMQPQTQVYVGTQAYYQYPYYGAEYPYPAAVAPENNSNKRQKIKGTFIPDPPTTGSSTNKTQVSNAAAIFGTLYSADKNSSPIFIPDGIQLPVVFIPDGSSGLPIHGVFNPRTTSYPDDGFIPDDPAAVARLYNFPGTIIPDGLTIDSKKGGIHGMITGDVFVPDAVGKPLWFNPENPEPKETWSPNTKAPDQPPRPKATATGELITYGVYFPGVSGTPDVFIPDGEGIPGYFIPNDPTRPEVITIPHGSFVATKPAGHGTFYIETSKEFAKVQQVRGAFVPDGMNLSGAISGLITKDLANSFVFVVDKPGQEFSYFKGKPEAQGMWTPFLKPGEWTPLTTTTSTPVAAPTTPAPGVAAKKKVANPAFMFGIKFPGFSSMEIFVPDTYPVAGQMVPEDSTLPPISGQLIVSKQPDTPFVFQATTPAAVSTLPATISAMFIPDGIAPGNGIMGELTPDSTKKNCTYQSDPPGKGYWYISGKPENQNVWTPFTPPVLPPPTKKPTIIDKIQSQKFLTGFYVPGIPGNEPVFIPEDGAVGCFNPDDTTKPKSCGIYYPEKVGSPAEFVQNVPNTLRVNTPGFFVPEMIDGSFSVDKFHATFVYGPPSTFILDKPSLPGWSQSNVKVSKTVKSTTTLTESHSSNIAIPVGSGFVGYPTNNKGIDALVDPNNPIFKEFLHWKSKKDKSIVENDKIVIMSNNQMVNHYQSLTFPSGSASQAGKERSGSAKTSYVNLEEYKSYVDERYTIKTTNIKTEAMNEMMELAVPKAAEKYVKKKKKPLKINVNVNSKAYAAASATAAGGAKAKGGASSNGGAPGTTPGSKCGNKWSTSASATAMAQNGSSANSDAHAINGGDAKGISLAKDGANANSGAIVRNGGQANAMAQSKNRSNGTATSNALNGGVANSLSKTSKDGGVGESIANAKKTEELNRDGCEGGAMPEEIEVDSHAAATALNNGTGTGGHVVNSYATSNVKIDMGSLMAKILEIQQKRSETDDDDDGEDSPVDININTNADAGGGAGAAPSIAGRSFRRGKSGVLKTRAGWKTEYKLIEPNCTFDHEDQLFYGLGSCPYTSDPDHEMVESDDPEDVINYYLQVLRLDCVKKIKVRVISFFNDNFLSFASESGGRYLIVPYDNPVVMKKKLTYKETRKLSAAFEIFVFSRTHFRQMRRRSLVDGYVTSRNGAAVSQSVQFLSEFVLNFVKTAREIVPYHYVRLTRNMLMTIRTVLVKLFQDGELLIQCTGCNADLEVNRLDKVRVMGLLQFLVHGLAAYDRGQGVEIRGAFADFLRLNGLKLDSRVNEYQLEFSKASKRVSLSIEKGEKHSKKYSKKYSRNSSKKYSTKHQKKSRTKYENKY